MPSPTSVVAVTALVIALGGTAMATGWPRLERLAEPFHRVGAAGQVAFGDGGQGDCLWGAPQAAQIGVGGLNPAAFYRDPFGEVHLVGAVAATVGAGGDGACGSDDALEDQVVFQLPRGYRPENVEVSESGAGPILVIAERGAAIGETQLPPGAIVPLAGFGTTILDGITFRAAGPGTRPIASAPAPSMPGLPKLRRELD